VYKIHFSGGFAIRLTILFLFFSATMLAQKTTGIVLDAENQTPLAFVNIIYNGDPTQGDITDIDGKFTVADSASVQSLTFSFIGYESQTIPYQSGKMVIQLVPSPFQLTEVVVRPGENPANPIIRQVIRNRKKNNPKNSPKFQYTSYNKVTYDFVPAPHIKPKALKKYNQTFKGGFLFLMESVTERRYIYPEISEEKVLATKVSGFKHPSFAAFPTDIQPFGFYKDFIPVYDSKYLNPISPGSLKWYAFHIEDTLFQSIDTTFIISFRPIKGKHFQSLKGLLYINTNHYAIQNVIASPFDPGLVDIKIQQEYEFIDQTRWFPKKLSFELYANLSDTTAGQLKITGKSYFKDINLSPDFTPKDLSVSSYIMEESAAHQPDSFWLAYRIDSLTDKENLTYQVVDSIGQKLKLDVIMNLTSKLSVNKIGLGIFDMDLQEIFVSNKYENLRPGLSLHTNEKLFKRLSLGAFAGYGLGDKAWKYGSSIIWTLNKKQEIKLTALYQNNLRETGRSTLRAFERNKYDTRTWFATKMDQIDQYGLALNFRAFRFGQFKLAWTQAVVKPQYQYTYKPNNQEVTSTYRQAELAFNFRYAFAEKFYETATDRVSQGTPYPIFFLSYDKGFKHAPFGLLSDAIPYHKLEAAITETIDIRHLGQLHYRLEGGISQGILPYGLLFSGEGIWDSQFSYYIADFFQTARPQEFLSDRYANFFLRHNFGPLFHIKKFSPHFILHHNMGWGRLKHPEVHQQISFSEKKNGFFESGLQLDNLLKINTLNVAYIGLGLGAFYRYGDYALDKPIDNFAFKFSVSYTTR